MSKKARSRKANRRRLESRFKSRQYRGVADMLKDFYDMKGKQYRLLSDGIVFKTSDTVWILQNHPRYVSGALVWGAGKPVSPKRFCHVRYLIRKDVEYLYRKVREELFRLWNESI